MSCSYYIMISFTIFFFFFFNDTATTEIYTLSLHDALPISPEPEMAAMLRPFKKERNTFLLVNEANRRSEEHTSELQSQSNLVCRLLLEKKKKKQYKNTNIKHVVILELQKPRHN